MYWDTIADAYLSDSRHRFVLVSLIGKAGSSYLQPGARMLVREDGAHWGGISAGCLEDTIADTAVGCLRSGKHRALEIDTRPYFGCFGQISVLLEILPVGDIANRFFDRISGLLQKRAHFEVITSYADLSRDCLTSIYDGQSLDQALLESVLPMPRILVIGDWPDGQCVAAMASIMGWHVATFDASEPGFLIEDAVEGYNPDSFSAVMVMTHNFARDILCLKTLLRMPFGYVGLIGSRKRREEVSNELAEGGDMELINELDRLHCPAGLDLGGEGHESIALSVIAEIQSTFHERNAASLRIKKQPVHAGNGIA